MQLDRFRGSRQVLEEACKAALAGLHNCLGGTAVHGDVRIPNICVRWVACCAQGPWGPQPGIAEQSMCTGLGAVRWHLRSMRYFICPISTPLGLDCGYSLQLTKGCQVSHVDRDLRESVLRTCEGLQTSG